MSLYSVGGNAGFALGPILVTPLVLVVGLHGTLLLVLPLLAMAIVLTRELGRLTSFRPDRRPAGSTVEEEPARPDRWGPFSRVAGVAAVRSGAYFGLQAFVPAYLIAHFGSSTGVANAALTTILVAGAIGTLAGGRLADRLGRRRITLGAAIGVGGIVAALLGLLADRVGLTPVLIVVAALPLPALLLALTLPRESR